jgi:hypothetical protein
MAREGGQQWNSSEPTFGLLGFFFDLVFGETFDRQQL